MQSRNISVHTRCQLPAYTHVKTNLHRAPVFICTHHHPHMLLHTAPKPIVTKHVFCHLQTQIHSAKQPRPHTHTKDPSAEELCVRSTSQAGKTSGKGLCSSKLLLNELIRHWYAKSCYKEREWEAGEKRKEGRCLGGRAGSGTDLKYGTNSLRAMLKWSGLNNQVCHLALRNIDAFSCIASPVISCIVKLKNDKLGKWLICHKSCTMWN